MLCLVILCSGWLLASWLFGQLTFWRLTISPSIKEFAIEKTSGDKTVKCYFVISKLGAFAETRFVVINNLPKNVIGLDNSLSEQDCFSKSNKRDSMVLRSIITEISGFDIAFENLINPILLMPDSNDTRRNGQPPKSQLTKKSTCQKSQLAKNTKHNILVILYSGWRFGQLTFWRLTISPSIVSNSHWL